MPTHYRPTLLPLALASISAQRHVEGVRQEVVVVHMQDDQAAKHTAIGFGASSISTTSEMVGSKRTIGLGATRGDIVIVADDDDLQSPVFLAAIILAFAQGAVVTGVREFRYVNLLTGACSRWSGANADVGYHRAYDRGLIESVGGWRQVPRRVESDLQSRLPSSIKEVNISGFSIGQSRVCDTMVNLQHKDNLWLRKFPNWGDVSNWGNWSITGEGHVNDATPSIGESHLMSLRSAGCQQPGDPVENLINSNT